MVTSRRAALLGLLLIAGLAPVQSQTPVPGTVPSWQSFLTAAGSDKRQAEAALAEIAATWRNGYSALLIDAARFLPPRRRPSLSDSDPSGGVSEPAEDEVSGGTVGRTELPTSPRQPPGSEIRDRLTSFLQKQTGQRFGDDLRAWRRWIWSQPPDPHPDYAEFKAELYARIDPRFRVFFRKRVAASIRLDEIDWGGVPVNGIPPLTRPKSMAAADATWLRDNHIVFGVEVNGEARAYPKRILAWHEMAIDRLGEVDLTIVYCTLCGTVIPYESSVGSRRFSFGTSGLLYRSNKLMFDQETASLWSSLEGVPVVGPLVGTGLRLPFHSVITTTWGEWRRDHPKTTVLSLETGFERNYAEGAAYRQYFGSDQLMFEVPTTDSRLKNKAEVLVLRPEVLGGTALPLAIAVDRLRREPIFAFEAGGRNFVVVTSKEGANRVYLRGDHAFTGREADGAIRDARGGRWTATPSALVAGSGERLAAVPAHRAFWFGWVAQHPATTLIR